MFNHFIRGEMFSPRPGCLQMGLAYLGETFCRLDIIDNHCDTAKLFQ